VNAAQNSIQSPKNDRCPVAGRLPKTESTLSPSKNPNPLSYLLLSLRRLYVLCVSLPRASRGALSAPSICLSFVFKNLQIPLSATHVFSHPYKTPGGGGTSVRLFTSPTSRTAGHERQVTPFHLLAASFALFTPFSALASFCFQSFAASFHKTPGVGVPVGPPILLSSNDLHSTFHCNPDPTDNLSHALSHGLVSTLPNPSAASLSSPYATFCTMAPARYILGGGLTSRFP